VPANPDKQVRETPVTKVESTDQAAHVPEIHIVSGGVGASGELLTHTVLAQFPGVKPKLIVHPHVHDAQEVQRIVSAVSAVNGVLLHTLVNAEIRELLIAEADRQGVDQVDIAGPVIDKLSQRLDSEPLGRPGLYRQLYDQYFKRVEAIEFTIAHDDGQRTAELDQADIVLMGVSRLGKTPLSVFLAMQGWKVANVPFVPGVKLPEALYGVDWRRIVGLTIEPPQLMVHRRWREQRIGLHESGYSGQKEIAAELREANRFFQAHDIPVVDVTNKPIETSGSDIVGVVTRRLSGMPETLLSAKARRAESSSTAR